MSESGSGDRLHNRLKILHIAGWYPSNRNRVAGVFVREHVKAASVHNDVVVLYSEGIDRGVRGLYQIQDNLEDGIRTLRLRHRKLPLPETTFFMFRAFRKLVKEGFKPDVIHAHISHAGFLAVLMGRRFSLPVVVTEHFSGFVRGSVKGIRKLKARFAFERADVVCPVSNHLRRHIEHIALRARFVVVPNTVDTSLFSPEDVVSNRGDLRKRLLVVAGLNPVKGIPYLLEALALLADKRDDFILDIVGDGSQRSVYTELVIRLRLQGIVRFHGQKPKQEVADFMRGCDIFVLPSLVETFGVVLIEALSCGKPVIATDSGGPNEIVTEEVGRIVPPANAESLAEAVEYMLDHYHEYNPKVIAGYARNRYSYAAVGHELDCIYRSVAKRKTHSIHSR